MDGSGAAARTGRLPQLAKYEVLEEIGHGGMATVYRARDKRLSRDVAVKVIHPHLRDSPEVAHRFSVEAKAVAKLRHGNIVEVFDVSGEDEPEQYLVVELLRGVTLRKLLQRHKVLPTEVAAALGIELLHALAHAHSAGVIHRDVKPENVILEHRADVTTDSDPSSRAPSAEPPGERVLVKLTDFGIAKLLDAQGVTSTGQVLGSPAHMAPEQIEGGDVDERADVFGLGVLLYECMVGHLPFEGNNPAQVLRRVLEGLYPAADVERDTVGKTYSAILDRALAHDVSTRFPSAAATRDALAEELKRLGITAPRSELEAWFDDPEGYEVRHTKRMIERLCELAADARKRGDALSAAGDYNRALAYAPNDPALMKIVATMHRAEARARWLKQAGRALVAMLALGAIAFFVTRAFKSKIVADVPPSALVSAAPFVSAAPRTAPSGTSSTASVPSAMSQPSATAEPLLPSALPKVVHLLDAGPARMVKRTVSLAVRPPSGVLVSVDGEGPIAVPSTLSLDGKAHALHFSCIEDMCKAADLAVAAGEEDTMVSVSLVIKPATLVVDGDGQASYQIAQRPQLSPRPGVPTRVDMKYGAEEVRVVQLPSGKSVSARLRAGKETRVSFPTE